MRTTERFKDGLAFELLYMSEVRNFHNRETGVEPDQLAAALILRFENEGRLLELLHEGKIEAVGAVNFDFDDVKDLQFRVVG